MPELPEVESVRRVLEPQLKERTIVRVKLRKPVVAHPSGPEFCAALTGEVFSRVDRRGKFLIFRLRSGAVMAAHLRMTGAFVIAPVATAEEAHGHAVFYLDGGDRLTFTDPRRFGRLWLLAPGEADTVTGMEKLGIEPFDAQLSPDYLRQALAGRRITVKQALLDQSVIAGIGNIYSDEICFAAALRPDRDIRTLTETEWTRLCAEIPRVVGHAVDLLGHTTAEEYLRGKGRAYRKIKSFRVYGHGGKPCPVCGEALTRDTIGGRTSVYCEHCQK